MPEFNNHKTKIRKITEIIINFIIVVLSCWILYKKLFYNQDLIKFWQDVKISFTTKGQFILMSISFLLMPVNIILEAIKWKIQIKPIEQVSLWGAFQAIFTGITAGMFFPNRTGDFLGRIFILERGNRIKATMVTIVGGMAQMIATVGFGLAGAMFFIVKYELISIIASILIVSLLILIFINIHILKYFQVLIPKRFKAKTKSYMEVFTQYDKKELLKILLLSVLKYLIYSFQFVLLIWSFKVPLNYLNTMIPISLTYLLMMVIPFITIMEIAVKSSLSIEVFEKWLVMNGINSSLSIMIFSASIMLWFFNIIIPALIGTLFIYRLKFFRKQNGS